MEHDGIEGERKKMQNQRVKMFEMEKNLHLFINVECAKQLNKYVSMYSVHRTLHISNRFSESKCMRTQRSVSYSGVQMRDSERKTNIEFSSFDVWVLLIVNEFSFEFVFLR